jgi:hypothetical protein
MRDPVDEVFMVEYFQPAIPILAMVVNMAAQLMAAQVVRRWGHLKLVAAGFAVGLLTVIALGVVSHSSVDHSWQDTAALMLVNIATYTAFAFCFFAGFINPAKTSLRIRLFKELQESKAGLSMEQILSFYDHRRVIELRLDRLRNNKQIRHHDGRYFLAGRFLWFAATGIRWAKLVVTGKESEFS